MWIPCENIYKEARHTDVFVFERKTVTKDYGIESLRGALTEICDEINPWLFRKVIRFARRNDSRSMYRCIIGMWDNEYDYKHDIEPYYIISVIIRNFETVIPDLDGDRFKELDTSRFWEYKNDCHFW